MKIKPKTREKYARFLSLTREDEPRPLARIPMDEKGVTAIEAFHAHESWGKVLPTREPLLLERYYAGKQWHGVTVQMVAEDYVLNRPLITSREIKEHYPAWVADEIFAQAAKIAQERLGCIPKFVSDRKDFSEHEIEATVP